MGESASSVRSWWRRESSLAADSPSWRMPMAKSQRLSGLVVRGFEGGEHLGGVLLAEAARVLRRCRG